MALAKNNQVKFRIDDYTKNVIKSKIYYKKY